VGCAGWWGERACSFSAQERCCCPLEGKRLASAGRVDADDCEHGSRGESRGFRARILMFDLDRPSCFMNVASSCGPGGCRASRPGGLGRFVPAELRSEAPGCTRAAMGCGSGPSSRSARNLDEVAALDFRGHVSFRNRAHAQKSACSLSPGCATIKGAGGREAVLEQRSSMGIHRPPCSERSEGGS
jgi:hypothetical protein